MASPLHEQQGSVPEGEPTLPSKRKLDPLLISPQGKEQEQEEEDEEKVHPNKTQKLQSFSHNCNSTVNLDKTTGIRSLHPSSNNSAVNSSISEEKKVSKAEPEGNDVVVEEEDDDGDDADADYDDDEEEEEEMNEEAAVVDRKGKGIMIEEEEDGDTNDNDSSGGVSELDGDASELEDDPLAEVDLDNILPSRTRRRAAQPGVYIANLGNNNDDSDDSNDSDA